MLHKIVESENSFECFLYLYSLDLQEKYCYGWQRTDRNISCMYFSLNDFFEEYVKSDKHVYAQAKFSFPLFGRKLEILTDVVHKDTTMETIQELLNDLMSRIRKDFKNELNEMSCMDYLNYTDDGCEDILDVAFTEGQIQVKLTDQKPEKNILDPDFKEDRITFVNGKLSEEDYNIYNNVHKTIKETRKKLYDEQSSGSESESDY